MIDLCVNSKEKDLSITVIKCKHYRLT